VQWIEGWIIVVFRGLLYQPMATITGLIALYIAWMQWRTNKNRLRLELYDRRYKVYSALQGFLSYVIHVGNIQLSDVVRFNGETAGSEFLFGEEVRGYLRDISAKAFELYAVQQQAAAVSGSVQANRERELKEWFSDKQQDVIAKFDKYLKVKAL